MEATNLSETSLAGRCLMRGGGGQGALVNTGVVSNTEKIRGRTQGHQRTWSREAVRDLNYDQSGLADIRPQ